MAYTVIYIQPQIFVVFIARIRGMRDVSVEVAPNAGCS